MASGRVKAEHMGAPTNAASVKEVLAKLGSRPHMGATRTYARGMLTEAGANLATVTSPSVM